MGTTETDREMLVLFEDSLRTFLAAHHDRRRVRGRQRSLDLWQKLAEFGILGLSLGEEDGGAGLGPAAVAMASRLFGELLVPEPFAACAVAPAVLIAHLPQGNSRQELASVLTNGTERIGFAWQDEPGQCTPFPTSCLLNAGGKLSGRKIFVPAPDKRIFVTAMAGDQPAILLVDLKMAKTISTHVGLDGVPHACIDFSEAAGVYAQPVLTGPDAEAAAVGALNMAILAASAQLAGLAAGVIELTLEYLRTRIQFGKPIGSYQSLQHRAVDARISIALAFASINEAARQLAGNSSTPHACAAVSAAKARASIAALGCCKEAIQMHGAIGFTEELDVGLYATVALKWANWFGGHTSHWQRFVKNDGESIHGW